MPVIVIPDSGYPVPDLSFFTRFQPPQCTWYAYGRMKQITGTTIAFRREYGLNANTWPEQVINLTRYEEPRPQSIAVFNGSDPRYGHLVFVYGVQGGTVLFSDSNGGRDHTKVYGCPEHLFGSICGGIVCYLQ